MKLTVKDMDIATGDIQVVILNESDAKELDLHSLDRLVISKGKRKTIAVLDIAESKKAVSPGQIGLFEETLFAIGAKHKDKIDVQVAQKPQSVAYIKKKLDGQHLTPKELRLIVEDIVENNLSDAELTSFVIASYTRGLNMKEIIALTKAMADTGEKLTFKNGAVVDLHSIGGVPGNRITMMIVPILVAAGCIVPKTSSRAITSPSGTADTMEVFCPVSLSYSKLKEIASKVGGFIIWGGAVNLAPADDKIIRIEHPLSIDAEGQMLASIMAKKSSVGATHLMMEIPIGPKAATKKDAKHLERHFHEIGNALGIKVKTVITDGTQPIGNGIGPVLEARDVLNALKCTPDAPQDLVKKSIELAGILLEFVKKAKKGEGKNKAKKLLMSGAAFGAFTRIVEAQGGKIPSLEELSPAKHKYDFRANKSGIISRLENNTIAKTARLAGAPQDTNAGIYIYKHVGDKIKKGEKILTVYAHGIHKKKYAIDALRRLGGIEIK